MRKRLVAMCGVLLLSACSSNTPTTATDDTADIAGGWTGTVQYTYGGASGVETFSMNLTQSGKDVSGTYNAENFTGNVSGTTTSTRFAGSFTFNSQTVAGTLCNGSFSASGSTGNTTMTWTSPAVSATCSGTPVNLTIAVQRRTSSSF